MIYEPSFCSLEVLFTSLPEDRPFIDLPITRRPEALPDSLRLPNSGVTRWGNLIIGLAVDGAMERGVSSQKIAAAFTAGRVAAHATMLLNEDSGFPQGYEGSITIEGDGLMVMVGMKGDKERSSIQFEKHQGIYAPRESRAEHPGGVDVVQFEPSFDELMRNTDRRLPPEFAVADEMGDAEEIVTSDPAIFVLRGDIPDLQP